MVKKNWITIKNAYEVITKGTDNELIKAEQLTAEEQKELDDVNAAQAKDRAQIKTWENNLEKNRADLYGELCKAHNFTEGQAHCVIDGHFILWRKNSDYNNPSNWGYPTPAVTGIIQGQQQALPPNATWDAPAVSRNFYGADDTLYGYLGLIGIRFDQEVCGDKITIMTERGSLCLPVIGEGDWGYKNNTWHQDKYGQQMHMMANCLYEGTHLIGCGGGR